MSVLEPIPPGVVRAYQEIQTIWLRNRDYGGAKDGLRCALDALLKEYPELDNLPVVLLKR